METTRETEYLIIGQGLAGTLMAFFLHQAGKSFLVVDEPSPAAATQVAAGLINPITGRRYVKSWRFDEILPAARTTFTTLESMLGIRIFHPNPILRALFNQREENDWWARSTEPGYQPYFQEEVDIGNYAHYTTPAFSYGEVRHSAQVNIGTLAQAFRDWLDARNLLIPERMDPKELNVGVHGVRYRRISARRCIFCEGYAARFNPYFNYLPFGGAKGEVLLIRLPEVRFDKILKHRVFIVPLPDGTYWVGSNYQHNFSDVTPTQEGGTFLRERLDDILRTPYEVVRHLAAVRPTVKDRRPFLGPHPEHPALYLFNGLGTKGASLGPFFARQLVDHLTNNTPIDEAVHINRFSPAGA